MEQYYKQMSQFQIFTGIKPDELDAILKCQGAYVKSFRKKENLLMAGDELKELRVIVEGVVEMFQEDFENNHHLCAYLEPGEFFGEHIGKVKSHGSVFTYRAVTDCVILYMDWEKIMYICTNSCDFHKILIRNMVDIFIEKNTMLTEKLEVMSRKTIREKLFAYFQQQVLIQKSKQLRIPFNRTELANYLCVNRSAMTRELMKMKEEGLIDFKDYTFNIK